MAPGLRGLCAAAVVFLAAIATVRALRRSGHFAGRPEPDLLGLLDLVALATVCDVMPLTGLNRALVAQGLRVMGRRARPGIAALLEVAMAKDHPTAFTCGYALGPRINAAGRIGESDLGLRLLLAADPVEARALAERLDATNRQRQDVEEAVRVLAHAQAEAQVEAGHAVLMVSHESWHPGIVGIVAGRLRERFNRPAMVAGLRGGVLRGSGRSVPGLDLGAAVIAALQSGLLLTGGGHAMAAGFTVAQDRCDAFHAFLNERLAAALARPQAEDLPVEGTVAVPGATAELAGQLGRLAPFGAGNEEPVLVLPRARILRADRVGREGNTLRAFVEGEGGGPRLKAMLFRVGEGAPGHRLGLALAGRAGAPVHLAGHLRAETWQGATQASFSVLDASAA